MTRIWGGTIPGTRRLHVFLGWPTRRSILFYHDVCYLPSTEIWYRYRSWSIHLQSQDVKSFLPHARQFAVSSQNLWRLFGTRLTNWLTKRIVVDKAVFEAEYHFGFTAFYPRNLRISGEYSGSIPNSPYHREVTAYLPPEMPGCYTVVQTIVTLPPCLSNVLWSSMVELILERKI